VRGSGLYGAWLNFPCEGNRFVASQLIDNELGCFGGRAESLIVRADHTSCIGPEIERTVEAIAGSDQG
jgi:hypothetical protein